jgi:hypothetical protein
MDLQVYYKKLREVREQIAGDDAIVVSKATADGGREGVMSEVPKATAANLIVEDRARLATSDEEAQYRKATEEAVWKAQEALLAKRVQMAVISDAQFQSMKDAQRKSKA